LFAELVDRRAKVVETECIAAEREPAGFE